MKINIILPGLSLTNNIAGGAKVIYQYSNFLVKCGHDVCIYFDLLAGENKYKVPPFIMRAVKSNYFKFNKNYPNWFDIDKGVKKVACDINDEGIRNADIIIATAFTTVSKVNNLSAQKGKKIYFIQDFENWDGVSDEDVYESYKIDFDKIVVSKWLEELVNKYSNAPCFLVPNGCDEGIFSVKKPIETRKKHSIAYLYSEDERKGCEYGTEIIKRIINMYPDTKIYMFGHPARPDWLPSEALYIQNATEKQVSEMMNSSSVYMCTSLAEGYGLPGLEAMLCGCALVSTGTKGVYEYADDSTALLSEPRDTDKMLKNICTLFDDSPKRVALAGEGNATVQDKKLSLSCRKFEKTLKKILKGGISE